MKQYAFFDDRYGDTVIVEDGGTPHLVSLFGMEMETAPFCPSRAGGLLDVFTSLGAGGQTQRISSISQQDGAVEIVLALCGGKLEYSIRLTRVEGLGMLVRDDALRNTTDETVYLMKAAAQFVFQDDRFEAYTQTDWWAMENNGAWNPVGYGGLCLACENGRTAQGHTPMLGLRSRGGRGVMVHLIPRGNWEMRFRLGTRPSDSPEPQFVLEAGDSSGHMYYPLGAGETYRLPRLLLLSMAEGLLGAQVNLQRYFHRTDAARFRKGNPLVYNTWLDRHDRLDVAHLKETAVSARALGAEIFVVDAGWYGNCSEGGAVSHPSGAWFPQAGDWREKTDGAFYGRLSEFAAYVRSLGMEFGLWIEPERFGSYTPAVKAHPELFAQGDGYLYLKLWERPARDYMYRQIAEVIERYDLAWLKIDFNFELLDDVSGCEFHNYYEAYYGILDELRARYPKCIFEGCSSGGQRNDIREFLKTDCHFLSDNGNDCDTETFFEQSCLRLPAYKCQKWFVAAPGPEVYVNPEQRRGHTMVVPQHPGGSLFENLETRPPEFTSLLMISSHFALSGNFLDMDAEQRSVIAKYIAIYKQYRDFYKKAVLILGREPGRALERRGFQHLQYLEEETGKGLVFVFKYDTKLPQYTLRLRELDPDGSYRVADAVSGEPLGVYRGADLLYRGLAIRLETIYSGKMLTVDPA